MVLGRFKQNSAVLYPSSYLGEICGEVGRKVRKGKRLLTSLLLLCLNVCTEKRWDFPFAGIHEHNWVDAIRTELARKGIALCDTVVCLSSSGRVFWLCTADSYINRWKAQFSLHCFCPLCSRFHKECHFFVCWTKGFLSEGADYLFRRMHVGEKCRALGIARFRAVQFMGVATASTCMGACILANTGLQKEMEQLFQCVGRQGPDKYC